MCWEIIGGRALTRAAPNQRLFSVQKYVTVYWLFSMRNFVVMCVCVCAIDVIRQNQPKIKTATYSEQKWITHSHTHTHKQEEYRRWEKKEKNYSVSLHFFFVFKFRFIVDGSKQRFDHSIRLLFVLKFQWYESIFIEWFWLMNSVTFDLFFEFRINKNEKKRGRCNILAVSDKWVPTMHH